MCVNNNDKNDNWANLDVEAQALSTHVAEEPSRAPEVPGELLLQKTLPLNCPLWPSNSIIYTSGFELNPQHTAETQLRSLFSY